MWQSADAVAEAGLRGLARGKAIVIPGAQNKALRAALKASPARLTRRVSKAVAVANGR